MPRTHASVSARPIVGIHRLMASGYLHYPTVLLCGTTAVSTRDVVTYIRYTKINGVLLTYVYVRRPT